MADQDIDRGREFLKDSVRLQIDFRRTPQNQGLPPPPAQKPRREDQPLIPLPTAAGWPFAAATTLVHAIANRRSRRQFRAAPLSLEELSFLLWSTQGVSGGGGPGAILRTVPSAGCRHAFETYLVVRDVQSLRPGLYRYLPLDRALVLEQEDLDLPRRLTQATLGQAFVANAPLAFVWTVVPYRMEWRYHTAAHRVLLIDIGHLCQNLYLACEAIGCGTCAVGAYHQQQMDQLLSVDGEDEFTLYLAPVGKV